MAVLKQTSPTAWPLAPRPKPSSTVPSASTSSAVALGSIQAELSCWAGISRLHSRPSRRRQSGAESRGSVLRDKINNEVKQAMKSQDKLRLSTLRLMNASIQNAEIDARTGAGPLTDDDILGLLQKMIKQREDSVVLYEQGGRKELADQERGEIEIIRGFLPQQMSEAEGKAAIGEVIKQTGAQGIKDMGKVMAALKQAYTGRMDFGKASGLVKGILAGG